MSTRFSAARPSRAGETYARQHHGTADSNENGRKKKKKVAFDVRNPSALAPEADSDAEEEEDAFLEADADVIRGSAATKRGAVNIDGYDSDSDREEMGSKRTKSTDVDVDEDGDLDVDDIFAPAEDEKKSEEVRFVEATDIKGQDTRSHKEVRFLEATDIEGQDTRSRSGGQVRLDNDPTQRIQQQPEDEDDDDEDAIELAIQEEGVDDEVGAGGLKKHAPKVEAFNLKAEHEEGRFDEAGNFVRKAADPDAVHDRWLEGVSRKDMRRAAEAHEKREAEQRARRREDDAMLTSDLLRSLILQLERGETALEALARLGKSQKRDKLKTKKVPKWKLKKLHDNGNPNANGKAEEDAMDIDATKEDEDPEQMRIKDSIDAITDAADKLLGRDRPDVYDRERELLIREYTRETDEEWVEPPAPENPSIIPAAHDGADSTDAMWEYRWTDGRDGADKQGPFDGKTMKAWQDAGYFGEGVEFRELGREEVWRGDVTFA